MSRLAFVEVCGDNVSMEQGVVAPILVVDDEPSIIALLREILVTEGYSVIDADSGQIAIDLMSSHPGQFGLVLADVIMPGMTGFELGSWIAQNRPETPVLYMTGHSDVTAPDGHTVLRKPFRVGQVLPAIKAAMVHPE